MLLHGADQGLVRERSVALERAVLESDPNPFQKIDLGESELRGSPSRLLEEAGAVTMLGGPKFIRVRCSADVGATALTLYLKEREGGLPAVNGIICFETGELRTKQTLRKLAESDMRVAAILCSTESQANLGEFIRTRLNSRGISADDGTLVLIAEKLAGDRAVATRELEKLEAYLGVDGLADAQVTQADVLAIMGDTSGTDFDELIVAAFSGNVQALAVALEKATAMGLDTGRVLRSALVYTDRLARKLNGLRTPMSYSQEQSLARLAGRWTPALAARARGMILEALIISSKLGRPSAEISERTLLSIANAVRR